MTQAAFEVYVGTQLTPTRGMLEILQRRRLCVRLNARCSRELSSFDSVTMQSPDTLQPCLPEMGRAARSLKTGGGG